MADADIRLAQLAQLTGLSPLLIRAWERRYQFPVPVRTAGGHRRYTPDQAETLRQAAALVRSGFRAREAIARARTSGVGGARPADLEGVARLAAVLVEADPGRALDQLRGAWLTLGFGPALEELVLPALRAVGDGWADGLYSVGAEHAATGVVMSWLGAVRSSLAGPDLGPPRYLLAAPAGEEHGVAVWALELLLRQRGVGALALGVSVPVPDLLREISARRPEGVVLGFRRAALRRQAGALARSLAATAGGWAPRIYAGGPGAVAPLPAGVLGLPPTLTESADLLAR